MHDGPLMDLLGEVFTTHGYDCTRQAALEGRSGTVYTIPLLAESGERAVIIDADLTSDPLDPDAVAAVADVLHDVGADHAVLCHAGTAASDASQDGVALWGHAMLLHAVGDARLSHALGTTPEPLRFDARRGRDAVPIAESLDEILPGAFHDRGQTAGPETVEPGATDEREASAAETPDAAFDLDALEHLGAAASDLPATPGGAGEDPPLADDTAGMPEPAPAFGHPVLPVRVTSDEARMAVKRRLETVDSVQMTLQPVHLIDYECDLLAEGSLRYDTVRGRVQVHGTDKTVTEVDPEAVDPEGFTRMPRLPGLPNHERTLRVSQDRARQRTTDFLMESHTRLVDIEVDDEDNGFSYTEKKKVAPRPDHVRLDPLGVFHRVIWRLVGPQGHIDVDALSGEVVDEVLQHPHTDAMMIE